jgi:type I restriction enzyme M protein
MRQYSRKHLHLDRANPSHGELVMSIQQILKNTSYHLDLFSDSEIAELETRIGTREVNGKAVFYVRCLVRDRDVRLKPEEVVRQLYLRRLLTTYGYPRNRLAVEFPVAFGSERKFADIVVLDKDHVTSPFIIVELKKPRWKEGKDQLKSYSHATGAPIGVWTNGGQISYYHRKDPNYFEDLAQIPNSRQTLADIISERFTIDDLIANDKLTTEKKSLKDIVLGMEDEVLANAGVDVFEEVFKLVFTKLYDEYEGARNRRRLLEFRNSGQTEAELKRKIQGLFDQAKQEWGGVFSDDAKISLTRSHLSICVSSLQNVKFFNSNLDVIDEAFEYLVNKSSKGEKGQYFTPRYVIDMCVKMLNPQEYEYLIDPAAGSGGFTVHSIFHVWKQIFDDEGIAASHFLISKRSQYGVSSTSAIESLQLTLTKEAFAWLARST